VIIGWFNSIIAYICNIGTSAGCIPPRWYEKLYIYYFYLLATNKVNGINIWIHDAYEINVVSGFVTVRIINIKINPPIAYPIQCAINSQTLTSSGYGII
jgi:hypothetical protein